MATDLEREISLSLSKTSENPVRIKEYSFAVDKYNNPREFKNFNAIGVLLMRLFFIEPGSITHSPEMGIGLISKFRYMTEERLGEFKDTVKTQIRDYIDESVSVDVNVRFLPNHVMHIMLKIDKYELLFSFNSDNQTLDMITNN